jgi:hypothetical protein
MTNTANQTKLQPKPNHNQTKPPQNVKNPNQVERVRLNLNANSGLMSERNREMLQYYQHSADNGNVNAQSTVGKARVCVCGGGGCY